MSNGNSSIVEETRWRSFRSINRNRPFKQARILATFAVLTFLYLCLLLNFQPQQDFSEIVKYNKEQSILYNQRLHQQSLILREKRLEMARIREEARIRRNQQRNATLFSGRNETVSNSNNTTTTLWTSTERRQQRAVLRFVGMMISFLAAIGMCAGARLLTRICGGEEEASSLPSQSQQRRSRRQEREARFQQWARRLNRQRQDQGERPLSLQSLRLVVRGRDFNTAGNDYEALLRIEEEAGPAMLGVIQSMGATPEEIARCPHRILREGDDLLQTLSGKEPPHCPVCLEAYVVEDEVRTIPCFHTFHTSCIDHWLSQKAVCPVCKHPAVG